MTRKPPDHPQPAPSKPPNVAAMQARLRAETIKLLGLRASKLDAGDEIMIARCGALRLICRSGSGGAARRQDRREQLRRSQHRA